MPGRLSLSKCPQHYLGTCGPSAFASILPVGLLFLGTLVLKEKPVKLCAPGCGWVFLLSLLGRPNTYLRGRGVKNRYCFLWISFSRKKYLSKWKCIKLRLSLCPVFLIQDSCYMTRSLNCLVLTYHTKTRFWKVHSPPPSLITSFPLDLSFSASDFYPFD